MSFHDKYEGDEEPEHHLIGRRVIGLWIEPEEKVLWFDTDAGWVSWTTTAECCSNTWFSDIVGLHNLLNATVQASVSLPLPLPRDVRSRQHEDKQYGIAIKTEWGTATVVYRNSSNGYYGGDCTAAVGGKPSPEALAITADDWSA